MTHSEVSSSVASGGGVRSLSSSFSGEIWEDSSAKVWIECEWDRVKQWVKWCVEQNWSVWSYVTIASAPAVIFCAAAMPYKSCTTYTSPPSIWTFCCRHVTEVDPVTPCKLWLPRVLLDGCCWRRFHSPSCNDAEGLFSKPPLSRVDLKHDESTVK